nr:probable indole-3-pyruvate monooxygenase YUCCA11 [Lolium perenne]
MEKVVVLIVGAGPAGLATAACLTQLSIPYVIIEREDCSASLWRNRAYDRLKLHLAKEFCELPHMSYPADAPTYIPKALFVKYVDDYIECFNIQPKYLTSVKSSTYDSEKKVWSIVAHDIAECKKINFTAKFLIVATGENSAENIPVITGLQNFPGETIHSSRYKSGKSFSGKSVLVIGSGNSGMEIAYDLATHGVNTSIVVRSRYVQGSISKIMGNIVKFQSGDEISFNAIVFATGYKSTTNMWLKNGESMLNDNGLPTKDYPNHWKGENGLYCAGLARRGLAGIAEDAKNIANDIKSMISSMSC